MSLGAAAPWSSLPPDLLRLILTLLPPRELFAAAAVCRAWRRHAVIDSLWVAHLARRLQESWDERRTNFARLKGTLTAQELWAMREAGELPALSMRDMYILSMAMEDKPGPHKQLTRKPARAAGAHLKIIRDAAQLGFDPLRHLAPSWANAVRLMRLWVMRGTAAVAAVGETCASYRRSETRTRFPTDLPPGPSFTSHRGQAYRTLIARCQILMGLSVIAPYAALCVLCRLLLPRYAPAFAMALAMPVALPLVSYALYVTHSPTIAKALAIGAAHAVHAALLHYSGARLSYYLRVVLGPAAVFIAIRSGSNDSWLFLALSLVDYTAPLLSIGLLAYYLHPESQLVAAVLTTARE